MIALFDDDLWSAQLIEPSIDWSDDSHDELETTEWSCSGLFEGTIPEFAWRGLKKPQETTIRMASLQGEIRIRDPTNMKQTW